MFFFSQKQDGETWTYITIYVDDLLIASDKVKEVDEVIRKLTVPQKVNGRYILTKPLQGKLFRDLKDRLLGYCWNSYFFYFLFLSSQLILLRSTGLKLGSALRYTDIYWYTDSSVVDIFNPYARNAHTECESESERDRWQNPKKYNRKYDL